MPASKSPEPNHRMRPSTACAPASSRVQPKGLAHRGQRLVVPARLQQRRARAGSARWRAPDRVAIARFEALEPPRAQLRNREELSLEVQRLPERRPGVARTPDRGRPRARTARWRDPPSRASPCGGSSRRARTPRTPPPTSSRRARSRRSRVGRAPRRAPATARRRCGPAGRRSASMRPSTFTVRSTCAVAHVEELRRDADHRARSAGTPRPRSTSPRCAARSRARRGRRCRRAGGLERLGRLEDLRPRDDGDALQVLQVGRHRLGDARADPLVGRARAVMLAKVVTATARSTARRAREHVARRGPAVEHRGLARQPRARRRAGGRWPRGRCRPRAPTGSGTRGSFASSFVHHLLERGGHRVVEAGDGRRLGVHHLVDRLDGRRALERQAPGQQLEQHDAEREQVAAVIDRRARAPARATCTRTSRGSCPARVSTDTCRVTSMSSPRAAGRPSRGRSRAPSRARGGRSSGSRS